MWNDNKRLLLVLIIVFVIINASFFIYLFLTNKNVFLKEEAPTQTTADQQIDQNIGSYSVREGDLNQIILGGLTIFGYIESQPVKNNAGKNVFTLSIPLKNGESFKSEVILGTDGDKISFAALKNSADTTKITWTIKSVNELKTYFIKGKPVTLELVYQQSTDGLDTNCDEGCKEWINDRVALFNNNSQLLKAIEGNTALNENVQIGPVQSIIFYND